MIRVCTLNRLRSERVKRVHVTDHKEEHAGGSMGVHEERGDNSRGVSVVPRNPAVEQRYATPTSEVSRRYWYGNSINSSRPSPRASWSLRTCERTPQSANEGSTHHMR